MDLVEAIPGNVLTKLFELAAFSNLSLGVEAKRAAMQKEGRQVFSFGEQVWIDSNLALERNLPSDGPKAERRGGLKIGAVKLVIAPLHWPAIPMKAGPFSSGWQGDPGILVFRLNFRGQRQAKAQRGCLLALIANPQLEFCFAIFRHASDRGQFDINASQSVARSKCVGEGAKQKQANSA